MNARNKTIPEPSGYGMMSVAMRRVMAVAVNGTGVVYDNDQTKTRIAFSLAAERISCDASALADVISKNQPVGREVVSAVISCGGELPYDVEVNTSSGGVSTIREAIKHFYASEDDTEARRALRSIYRHLSRLAVAS
jgi:hypothetical protein